MPRRQLLLKNLKKIHNRKLLLKQLQEDNKNIDSQDTIQNTITRETIKIFKYLSNNNPLITFVMPSINRPNINITIQSLLNQTIPNWNLVIVFDNIDNSLINIPLDPRITYINLKKKYGAKGINHGNAGLVRNHAYKLIKSEWIGYIDDDDSLSEEYIYDLLKEIELKNDIECVLFRSLNTYTNDNSTIYNYIPENGVKDIIFDSVPISFCHKKCDVEFINSDSEDYIYLNTLKKMKKKICISPKVNYFVRKSLHDCNTNLNRAYINC